MYSSKHEAAMLLKNSIFSQGLQSPTYGFTIIFCRFSAQHREFSEVFDEELTKVLADFSLPTPLSEHTEFVQVRKAEKKKKMFSCPPPLFGRQGRSLWLKQQN